MPVDCDILRKENCYKFLVTVDGACIVPRWTVPRLELGRDPSLTPVYSTYREECVGALVYGENRRRPMSKGNPKALGEGAR